MSFRGSLPFVPAVGSFKAPQVVMINETNGDKATEKVLTWVMKHYPGSSFDQLALVKHNNRLYTRVNFRTAHRQRKIVFFDVTAAFASSMSTSERIFSGGTMARIVPGTTTTSTKVQFHR